MSDLKRIVSAMRAAADEQLNDSLAFYADQLDALACAGPVAYTDESSLKWLREQNEQGNRNASGIMYGYPHIYTVPLYTSPQPARITREALTAALIEFFRGTDAVSDLDRLARIIGLEVVE